jgi:hypothetical protein
MSHECALEELARHSGGAAEFQPVPVCSRDLLGARHFLSVCPFACALIFLRIE